MEEAKRREIIEAHAPKGWEKRIPFGELLNVYLKKIKYAKPMPMVVLSADISSSTKLLAGAEKLGVLADNIREFFGAARKVIVDHCKGWFDKFMGDGLLAFWPCPDEDFGDAFDRALQATFDIAERFDTYLPRMLACSPTVETEEIGLRFGLGAGPAYMAFVAKDLTVIGMPAVVATRMEQAARRNERLCSRILRDVYLSDEAKWRQRGYILEAEEQRPVKDKTWNVSPIIRA